MSLVLLKIKIFRPLPNFYKNIIKNYESLLEDTKKKSTFLANLVITNDQNSY